MTDCKYPLRTEPIHSLPTTSQQHTMASTRAGLTTAFNINPSTGTEHFSKSLTSQSPSRRYRDRMCSTAGLKAVAISFACIHTSALSTPPSPFSGLVEQANGTVGNGLAWWCLNPGADCCWLTHLSVCASRRWLAQSPSVSKQQRQIFLILFPK